MKKLKIILQSNLFYLFLFILLVLFLFLELKVKKYSSLFYDDTNQIIAKIQSFKIDGDKVTFYLSERETFTATYYISSEKEKKDLESKLEIGRILHLDGKKQEI